jgi:hypothetical protein
MKKILKFWPLLLLLVLLNPSCKKKEYSGKLHIVFEPVIHGAAVTTNGFVYQDPAQSARFNVSTMMFYVSNFKFVKNDNSSVSFNDADHVGLLQWGSETDSVFNITLDVGAYKAFSFNIGLDSTINATDPGSYPADHALSGNRNTWWGPGMNYVFMKYEGAFDSINKPRLNKNYLYHLGKNPLYRAVPQINESFVISASGETTITVYVDMLKVINGPPSHLNLFHQNVTQSEDASFGLANQVMNNFANSFYIQ